MCLLFFPIQVSTDGYVSLDDALTFEFTPFPLPAPNTSPVIAPLWFRTSSVNTIDYRIASDAETLANVSSILTDFIASFGIQPILSTVFQPRAAVIVTWFFSILTEVIIMHLLQT